MRVPRCRAGTGYGVLLPWLFTATAAAGAPRMRTPMTYVIDYSTRFLGDRANILAYADAPPDLMHVGKSVPILHNWGPVPLISGENQYTGGPKHTLSREAIRLLTPRQLEARIRMLKKYTKQWHDVGVPLLMPYSAIHTIAGDHETREGFWHFYDHWDDYAKWLGPKPKQDPFDWLMVDKRGEFVPGACGGYSPAYFAPLHRYRVCPEHPAWRKFQVTLTKLIAEAGYDGVFPDNSSPRSNICYCKYCQRNFKEFVKNLPRRTLDALGVRGDAADVDLLSEKTPAELIRRYRIAITARWQLMVRDAGRTVNPRFQVFPNVNSYTDFMLIGEACDFLMFESTNSPGTVIGKTPPDQPFPTIEVTATEPGRARETFNLNVLSDRTFMELAARIDFPTQASKGRASELAVTVNRAGASNKDNDYAENFEIVLTNVTTGRKQRVALEPHIAIGGKKPGARRPPVTLKGRWTPDAAGRYRMGLACQYTDPDHVDAANALPCTHDLTWGALYHTHIGQMLFTMHAGARTVLLDYKCRGRARERVMELGLAECAAFSNGSTIAGRGNPRKKYHRFFKRSAHLYEGFEPYADIGLLYSYWGHNPGGMGLLQADEITPSVDLSGRQRPIKVLVDRTIDDTDLASLRTLILSGHALEMSDDQIAAIRRFRRKGGALYVFRPDTTVNGKPLSRTFRSVRAWKRGTDPPGHPSLIKAQGFARGLRFSAFVKPEERRMTLHVVNYNVRFRETPATVEPVEDVVVALPVPDGWTVRSVKSHDPDVKGIRDLPFAQEDGVLKVTLPKVRIYKVVEVAGG